MGDNFITVAQLTPGSRNVNLRVKVADLGVVCRAGHGCQVAEAVVGDASGVISMLVSDDQIPVMQPGCPVVLRNAHVVMVRNMMRLCVNKEFGLLQPLSKDDPSAPQLRMDSPNDVSVVEYQLV